MNADADNEALTFWTRGEDCCDPTWEAAYARFETPADERLKFRRRLCALGIDGLPRNLRVADLFCGRGSNLDVLEELGFTNLIGVDLSPALLRQHKGRAKLFVGDCRDLKLPDASVNLILVQGGLHHLPLLPQDLEQCFAEISRVLSPEGLVAFVEPALTPFLRLVHLCCRNALLRKLSPRLDALAVMIEHERETYFNWLSRPDEIRELAARHFDMILNRTQYGKWFFLGRVNKPVQNDPV
ncbi:MAG: methyltransferase domain-containing protein [Opitutales bacterium]|jgi:ubiquinone/menaquinone biosynthesis C-methylase UbiE